MNETGTGQQMAQIHDSYMTMMMMMMMIMMIMTKETWLMLLSSGLEFHGHYQHRNAEDIDLYSRQKHQICEQS